ncbi:MAG: aspartate 1-decarboxylase [Candidatus Melainabacteria bacterium]|jgi:aspartate 1-decarboxylase
MLRTFFHSKIHRATITSTDLDYEGSITIDIDLLKASRILPYEQVHVLDINNGNRFVTYTIPGEAGSGTIQVNGAAAHLCKPGDLIIILNYCQLNDEEIKDFKQLKIQVDQNNRVINSIEDGGIL